MFSSLLTRGAVHCTRVNASVPVLGHLLLTSGSAATQQQPSYGHCNRHHAWQQHEQHQQQHSYPQQQHQLQRRWICSSQDTCSDSKPPPNTESVNDDGATAAGDGDGGGSDGEGTHHATRTKVTAAGAGGEGYAMVRGHSVPMGALKQDEEQTEGDATEVEASGTPNAAQAAAATAAATEVQEGEAAVTATPEKPAGVFGLPAGMARSVAILTTSQFIITTGFGVIIPVLPMLATEMNLGAAGVGAIIAAPSAMRVLLNMKMGQACDVYGRKPLMVFGTVLTAAGSIGTAFAGSLLALLPFRALVGTGSAASMAGSSAYMADITAEVPQHRAKLLGVQQTMILGAFVAGPAIGGWLATVGGPSAAFMVVGGLAGLCSFGYSMLPETLTKEVAEKQKAAQAASGGGGMSAAFQVWMDLLKNPHQQAIIAMQSALFLIYAAELSVVPLHAANVWQATPGQLGVMFSVVSLTGLIGAPLGGWAADRFGRRGAILPPALLAAAGMGALPFATDHFSFMLAMGCLGLSTALMGPGLNAYAADVAPEAQRAQALSLGRQAGDIIFAVGPLALGLAADGVFGCGGALGTTAAIAAAACGFFAWRAAAPLVPQPTAAAAAAAAAAATAASTTTTKTTSGASEEASKRE